MWGGLALAALGGIAGAALGCLLFLLIARQGFYAMALPGALTGLGCGSFSRRRSVGLGIASAVVGAIAGIVAEWLFAPFVKDRSLTYFLTHLQELKPFTQAMIALGAGLAFWFGMGRNGGPGDGRKTAALTEAR